MVTMQIGFVLRITENYSHTRSDCMSCVVDVLSLPVADSLTLVCRLGLTKEESLQQNVGQEEVEVKSDLHVSESTRPQRGPATRQRDGHFKKRSRPDLRTRARRNLYKRQEPEQAEITKDTQSVAPDIPSTRTERLRPTQQGWAAPTHLARPPQHPTQRVPNSRRKLWLPGSSPVPTTQHVSPCLQTEFPACRRRPWIRNPRIRRGNPLSRQPLPPFPKRSPGLKIVSPFVTQLKVFTPKSHSPPKRSPKSRPSG